MNRLENRGEIEESRLMESFATIIVNTLFRIQPEQGSQPDTSGAEDSDRSDSSEASSSHGSGSGPEVESESEMF